MSFKAFKRFNHSQKSDEISRRKECDKVTSHILKATNIPDSQNEYRTTKEVKESEISKKHTAQIMAAFQDDYQSQKGYHEEEEGLYQILWDPDRVKTALKG